MISPFLFSSPGVSLPDKIIQNPFGHFIGKPKQGVRWHLSYDVDHVFALVEKKVNRTLGTAAVNRIDVEIVSHTTGSQMDTKNLSME